MSSGDPKKCFERVLLMCNCCFDEGLKLEECLACEKGCTFCRFCVELGTETRLADGFADCGSEFNLQTLQLVLQPAVFNSLIHSNGNKSSHEASQCHETETDEEVKMRTYIENKMTEAIVRSCPSCKKAYVKESGCSKVICVCGTTMHCKISVNDTGAILRAALAAKAELGIDVNPDKLKIDPTRDLFFQ